MRTQQSRIRDPYRLGGLSAVAHHPLVLQRFDSGRFNHSVGKTVRPIERAAASSGLLPFTLVAELPEKASLR